MIASLGQFALSDTLYDFCNTTLRQCDKFNSYESLQTVFVVHDLIDYMPNLPRAGSPAEQVDQTMSYLSGKIHKGHLVFLIFLRRLRRDVPQGDALYQELSKCCDLVEQEYWLFQVKPDLEEGRLAMPTGSRNEPKDVVELIQHLLKCRYMNNREQRKEVVNKLSTEGIACNITSNEQDSDFANVWHMLKTCSQHPDGVGQLAYTLYQLEGKSPEWQALDKHIRYLYNTNVTYTRLKQLLSKLREMTWPEDILRKAYIASMPEGREIPGDDESTLLLSMLDELAKVPRKRPIVEFVEHLAYYAEKQQKEDIRDDLKDWSKGRANELGMSLLLDQLRTDVQRYTPPHAAYLLIAVNPHQGEQTFEIQAWLLNSKNKPVEKTAPYISKYPVTLDGVPECIDEIRTQYAEYLSRELTVELLLPNELLCYAADHWPIDLGMEDKAKLGHRYKVVVRSLKRACNKLMWADWQYKWNKFQKFKKGEKPDEGENPTEVKGPIWICEEEECKEEELFGVTLYTSHVVCVALVFVPPSPDATHVFKKALSAGIPIALWPRQHTNHPGTVSDLFKSLLLPDDLSTCLQNLSELPQLVWKERVQAVPKNEHHHGHHLTLLWDDPQRLPPGSPAQALKYLR